ncbi:MAG: hypothetical protein Q8O24_02155 [Gallionellaceae bacterium]|nr:hypothetical protein [Gallionellaceae bacterium]
MQVHQAIPYGLLYSVAPQDFAKFNLRESSIHDEFEWEAAAECCDEAIATSVPIQGDELND